MKTGMGILFFCLCLAGAVLCSGCIAGTGDAVLAGTWIPISGNDQNPVESMTFYDDGRFSELATNGNSWNGTWSADGSIVTVRLDVDRYLQFTLSGNELMENGNRYTKSA